MRETINDSTRDNILMLMNLGIGAAKVSTLLNISNPTVYRVMEAYRVAEQGDPEKVNEFLSKKGKGSSVKANWEWAIKVTGYKYPEPEAPPVIDKPEPEFIKDSEDKLDEMCMRLGELHRMIEKNMYTINTALTTILDCWGTREDTKEEKNGT